MDMPEGYKNLKEYYDELYPNDLYDLNVFKALELLKEMAEALENSFDALNEHEKYKEKTFKSISEIQNILFKFKEWK